MSRRFVFNVGSRSPKDDERLLRAVMRQAQPGDDVQVNSTPPAATGETPQVCNEPLEKEFGEKLNSSLEKKNEELDAAPQPQGGITPQEQARRTHDALQGLAWWRTTLNQEGVKWVVTAVLRTAWEQREELWRQMKEFVVGR